MNILDYVYLGWFINTLVVIGIVTFMLRIRATLGEEIYDKVTKKDYEISKWILILILIPYKEIISLVRFVYFWVKLGDIALVDKVKALYAIKPSFIDKLFILKENNG